MDIDEADVITFDFTDGAIDGEEILSADITVTVLEGVDATPDIRDGVYHILGMTVLQKVAAPNRNVTYHLRCTATTNLRVLVWAADLPVIRI